MIRHPKLHGRGAPYIHPILQRLAARDRRAGRHQHSPLPPAPPAHIASGVRCPACGNPDDRVVDSRTSEDGTAIRRRRECLTCGRRFTTFERADELPLVVRKRSGHREPFDREKIVAGLRAAAKNRPVTADALDALAGASRGALPARRRRGHQRGGRAGRARAAAELDQVASVRFASVYKEFDDPADFARERAC